MGYIHLDTNMTSARITQENLDFLMNNPFRQLKINGKNINHRVYKKRGEIYNGRCSKLLNRKRYVCWDYIYGYNVSETKTWCRLEVYGVEIIYGRIYHVDERFTIHIDKESGGILYFATSRFDYTYFYNKRQEEWLYHFGNKLIENLRDGKVIKTEIHDRITYEKK